VSPDGQWGPASQATAERGKFLFDWMVSEAVRRIRETLDQVEALRGKETGA